MVLPGTRRKWDPLEVTPERYPGSLDKELMKARPAGNSGISIVPSAATYWLAVQEDNSLVDRVTELGASSDQLQSLCKKVKIQVHEGI